MPRIPLEDNFDDVIRKAQRGRRIPDEQLAFRAGVSLADLKALQQGKRNTEVLRRVARHLKLHPDALEVLADKAWYPDQPAFPHGFAMFNSPHGDMTVNSYLVWDARTRVTAAFDTGTSAAAMLDTIGAEKLDLRYIFITHTHEDHVAALPQLAAAAAPAGGSGRRPEVWSSELEPVSFPQAKTFKENAHFHAGGLAIKTLATGGHSPGGTTYYVTGLSWPLAIVGDALFSSSIGGSKTDFLLQLQNDLEKILSLPRDTVLACGHGPLTTVAQERRHNPFFKQ